MEVSYFENKGNAVGWFILKALDTNLERAGKLDGENLDIKLSIDGIEFNFVEVVEKMVNNYDEEIENRAKELLKEKMDDDVFRGINEIAHQADILKNEIDSKIDDLWNK